MKYCSTCGTKLIEKRLEHEGLIPYCPTCHKYCFPLCNTAVSMIALNPTLDKILLIQQYQKANNVLVAGYINKGESAEEALVREMKEEIGREVCAYQYLKSEYFQKTNTLIFNYAVVLDDESLDNVSDWEVDKAQWFSLTEARVAVKPNSLAQRFLWNFLDIYAEKQKDFFTYI